MRKEQDRVANKDGVWHLLVKATVILLLGKVVLAPNRAGEEYGFLNMWREE